VNEKGLSCPRQVVWKKDAEISAAGRISALLTADLRGKTDFRLGIFRVNPRLNPVREGRRPILGKVCGIGRDAGAPSISIS
jgi:hypothetical protein